jgi:hypothetical protein
LAVSCGQNVLYLGADCSLVRLTATPGALDIAAQVTSLHDLSLEASQERWVGVVGHLSLLSSDAADVLGVASPDVLLELPEQAPQCFFVLTTDSRS